MRFEIKERFGLEANISRYESEEGASVLRFLMEAKDDRFVIRGMWMVYNVVEAQFHLGAPGDKSLYSATGTLLGSDPHMYIQPTAPETFLNRQEALVMVERMQQVIGIAGVIEDGMALILSLAEESK
jgi:hypothetical protein